MSEVNQAHGSGRVLLYEAQNCLSPASSPPAPSADRNGNGWYARNRYVQGLGPYRSHLAKYGRTSQTPAGLVPC